LSDDEYAAVEKKIAQIKEGTEIIKSTDYTPNKEFIAFLESIGEERISDKINAQQIIARKSFTLDKLTKLLPELSKFDAYIQEQILVEAKYARYVEKQQEDIEKMKKNLNIKIPKNFDFAAVRGFSNEVIAKMQTFQPPTLQAASQISGITPAAIEILHIYIKMAEKKR
jgi:tRNA uridine 5-carboxymethylaminomethyl modification enzyme